MKKNLKAPIVIDIKNIIRQHCPTCNRYVKLSTRYPNYACVKCQALAVDAEKRKVVYLNTTEDGHGCKGVIIESNEILMSNICFIKELRFKVEEAYLGGIVYLPFPKRKRKTVTKELD